MKHPRVARASLVQYDFLRFAHSTVASRVAGQRRAGARAARHASPLHPRVRRRGVPHLLIAGSVVNLKVRKQCWPVDTVS